MTPYDLRLFCTALGFTAVVIKGGEDVPEGGTRALAFARLIEAFCRHTPLPCNAANEDLRTPEDEVIAGLKADLRGKGEADMGKSREELLGLYDRLRCRYAGYASDDMIADRVLELLDAELDYEERQAGGDGIS